MIKVLLFDFHGVFIPDSYGRWLQKNGLRREGVFNELINERDQGIITEEQFVGSLSRELGRDVHGSELRSAALEPNTDLISFTRDLSREYKVCLFSNASPALHGKISRLGIGDLFEEVIISSEIGYVKPTDEAFAIAAERVGVPRNEIFFIDDNPINIEAALRNDMRASLYTSLAHLKEAIKLLN